MQLHYLHGQKNTDKKERLRMKTGTFTLHMRSAEFFSLSFLVIIILLL